MIPAWIQDEKIIALILCLVIVICAVALFWMEASMREKRNEKDPRQKKHEDHKERPGTLHKHRPKMLRKRADERRTGRGRADQTEDHEG